MPTKNYGKTEYPNSFKRQSSFPLDDSYIQASYLDAVEYAASNGTAYEGQVIAIAENNEVRLFVLRKSNKENINFELDELISVNRHIGDWVIIKHEDNCEFSCKINYPFTNLKYHLCMNNDDVVEIDNESSNISIKLFDIISNYNLLISNELLVIKSKLITTYEDDKIKYGVLVKI